MKKRFFAIIWIFFAFAFVLDASRIDEQMLLKKVPVGADWVISADVSAWLELPAVKKRIAENRDLAEFQKSTSLEPGDLSALLLWGSGEKFALLTAWKKKVDPEKLFQKPYFSCSGKVISGIKVWDVKSVSSATAKSKRGKRPRHLEFRIAVLSANVMVFFQNNSDIAGMLKLMKNSLGITFPAAAVGSLRGFLRNGQPPMPEQAWLSCRMTGKNKSDLQGTVSVTAKNAEEAAQMCGQAMLMTNIILSGAMQNDPKLAADIVQSLKFNANGRNVTLKFNIAAALLERIGNFAAEKAKEKKALRKRGKQRKNRTPYQGNKPAVNQ